VKTRYDNSTSNKSSNCNKKNTLMRSKYKLKNSNKTEPWKRVKRSNRRQKLNQLNYNCRGRKYSKTKGKYRCANNKNF
jgi:hypothetical protein